MTQHEQAEYQKIKENRLRNAARRQDLMLCKSRVRNVQAYEYGGFMLLDASTKFVVFGADYGLTFTADLDEVEEFLSRRNAPSVP